MNTYTLKTSGKLKENNGLSFDLQGSWQVFASDPFDCKYLHTSTAHKAKKPHNIYIFKVNFHSEAK